MTLQEATAYIARAAVTVERETGFPAEVIAAQAALESGWLGRAPGNNAFGWKAIAGQERQLLETSEWLDAQGVAEFTAAADGRCILRATGRTNGTKAEYRVMDWFAKFPDLPSAFRMHAARLMTIPRYRAVWEAFRARTFATEQLGIKFLIDGIAKAGYATAPDYAERLFAVAIGRRLSDAIAIARAQGGGVRNEAVA